MHESTTRAVKPWGLSGYSNILPRIKYGVIGQEGSPQSITAYSLNRYLLIYRKLDDR
jgi:hypothetical protein